MIVDASVLVAIVSLEPDAPTFVERLSRPGEKLTHPISVYEAATALVRLNRITAARALDDLRGFMAEAGIAIVPIDDVTASAAIDAFARYGKGNHPTRLNMGDCFSYAVAKLRGMPLLYKGDDFAHTDLPADLA